MAVIHHLVSGDSLAESLRDAGIEGDLIVCRECLVDGPLPAFGDGFWETRAYFIATGFGAQREGYFRVVVPEFERLRKLGAGDELNLWFGDDLFCQVNSWFCAGLIAEDVQVFRVFPSGIDFGREDDADLNRAIADRVKLRPDDLSVCRELFDAYAARDGEKLRDLGRSVSTAFRRLDECCEAAAGMDSKPFEILEELREQFGDDFSAIFTEFSRLNPIYGFGDTQVRMRLG